MTETEWLACADPGRLFESLRGHASARKLRLLTCATAREVGGDKFGPPCEDTITFAEQYADGMWSERERADIQWAAAAYCFKLGSSTHADYLFAALAAFTTGETAGEIEIHIASAAAAGGAMRPVRPGTIREVFGNPFRPVTFAPAWRTATVTGLARQMYESRDFGAMPILADALQDAGCDSEDILSHAWGDGPHVRGCWVVDLVLGKE
jgi:hypothetical protein